MIRMSAAGKVHHFISRLHSAWRRIVTKAWYGLIFKHIGHRTTIYRPEMLINPHYMTIGNKVLVRHGARIEVVIVPDIEPSLIIGNNVNIEQNVHIICHDRIVIGDNVSITGNCAIVDVTHPQGGLDGKSKTGDAIAPGRSFVEIGEGAFIGFGSTILPNVRLGRYCVIGAGSVVTRDVPDYAVAAGIPAQVIRVSNLKA